MNFSTLLKHSRPRFWHYLFGPMLVLGAYFLKIGIRVDEWMMYIYFLFFTTFIGNLFVYGVNDIYDEDTDQHNHKKQGYETKIEKQSSLGRYILLFQALYFLLGMVVLYSDGSSMCIGCPPISIGQEILNRIGALISPIYWGAWIFGIASHIGLFYILSWIYSAPPIRAKARPFLDGITNCLYIIIPSILLWNTVGYEIGGISYYWHGFFAARLRCIAMHCFSAIPDIEPDTKAGITTTAVYLGKTRSLWYCIMLYALAGILASQVIGVLGSLFGLLYCGMVMLGFRYDIFRIYKWFPYINFFVGMLLCFYVYFVL